jgi:hypothetical protein
MMYQDQRCMDDLGLMKDGRREARGY